MRISYLALLPLLLAGPVAAQQLPAAPAGDSAATTAAAASPRRDKPSFIPLPIVFSQPETGLGYGLALLPVWRWAAAGPETRKSNARLLAWRTQKSQSLVQLTHNVFTPGEKLLLTGEASYFHRFPINYYGTGPHTRLVNKSVIQYQLLILQQRVLRRVAPNWFAGGLYRLTHLRDVRLREGINQDPTRSRLFDRPAREYQQNTLTSGLGPALLYDGRDNVLSTFQGSYLDVSTLFNARALGSELPFTRFTFDARHFRQLALTGRPVLALQLVGQFHAGRVPFRELANLGGDRVLRGYYEGRYRDRQLLALQAELRCPLFWRFGAVLFGGLGQVGYRPLELVQNSPKGAAGAGLRFAFNRADRLNLRLDYGRGKTSSGVYFSINEAF
ncbi:outer membrane protein assembly factor [Hymenobacter weizhouensis]|uniref:outer membrane protein assembly factor n=1 Tax=Hymenobacter sp. YIM 151500-1 TaxID=2987689 RepID=UPI002226798E|nr:outer membrane protein assembly factor [Hymenobacter sp. YIM 151500-1]UYZ63822.1 outer membrane protein assembly factor [Hymenobacter sp. YIM 151500-1]